MTRDQTRSFERMRWKVPAIWLDSRTPCSNMMSSSKASWLSSMNSPSSPGSVKSVCAANSVRDLRRSSLSRAMPAAAIAASVPPMQYPIGAGDRERRADRRHEALAPIVVEADVAVARGRIAPRDAEDRESAVYEMLDQRVLRLQIEDIVFHDPRRRDDDRLRAYGLVGGAVLDDLSEVSALDDDALGQGDRLPRLERFGRLAALVVQQAPKIGRNMQCSSV